MTAAAWEPVKSVNQHAAENLLWASRVDDDTPHPDARRVLEVLGVLEEGGHELLSDLGAVDPDTPLGQAILAARAERARATGVGPLPVIDAVCRNSTTPEGLRNLPAAPPSRKDVPMPPAATQPAAEVYEAIGDWAAAPGDPTPPADPVPVPQLANVDRESAGLPYVAVIADVDLFVDESYQRPLDEVRVRRMAADWNPRMLGILDVSDRGPDAPHRFAIVNGQHRRAAARTVGVTWFACNVHEGLIPADEARLMFDLDKGTKALASWDKWKARRASGDPMVVGVEEVAARHGLKIRPDMADGSVGASGAAERLYRTGGAELLHAVLTILIEAYGKQNAAFKAPMLTGLGELLRRHGADGNAERLVLALARTTPQQIRAQADGYRQVDQISLASAMTYTVTALYNRAPGAGPRLAAGKG